MARWWWGGKFKTSGAGNTAAGEKSGAGQAGTTCGKLASGW